MALTADELQKREAELERNQRAWNSTKVNLERECLKIKGEIEFLTPKRDELRESVETARADLTSITDEHTDTRRQLEATQAELSTAKTSLEGRHNDLQALDNQIEERKAGIDVELAAHEQQRRVELKAQLQDLNQSHQEFKAELKRDQARHEEAVNRLEELKADIRAMKDLIKDYGREITQHQATIEQLKLGIKALAAQDGQLAAKVAERRLELAKIEQAHKDFLLYEKKAWAALNTMDESLQDRMTEVERLERVAINKQSFLPPR